MKKEEKEQFRYGSNPHPLCKTCRLPVLNDCKCTIVIEQKNEWVKTTPDIQKERERLVKEVRKIKKSILKRHRIPYNQALEDVIEIIEKFNHE